MTEAQTPVIITPTPGRVVWYRPSRDEIDAQQFAYFDETQPLAATVGYVWNDRMVNLSVVDQNGATFRRTSVQLVQDGDETPNGLTPFAEWVQHQKGQAAKPEHGSQPVEIVTADGGTNEGPGVHGSVSGQPLEVETKTYTDGTTATGTAPLPDASPTGAPAAAPAAAKIVKKSSGKAKTGGAA